MATFTPPTHTEYFDVPGGDRLWRRVPYQRGDAVLVTGSTVYPTAGQAVQVVDGDARVNADYYFGDGNSRTVSPDVEVLLVSAGYELSLTDETWFSWL